MNRLDEYAVLTRKQKDLLDFIAVYQQAHHGVSPKFSDMAEAIGLASKSGVHRLLDALHERGYVHRLKNRQRAIDLLPKPGPRPRYAAFRFCREMKELLPLSNRQE